jgi:hypothetical protein
MGSTKAQHTSARRLHSPNGLEYSETHPSHREENLLSVAENMLKDLCHDICFRHKISGLHSNCIGQFHSIQEKFPKAYILPQNSLFTVQHVCAPGIRQNLGFAEGGGRALRYPHVQSSYEGPTRSATCLCIILCVHTAHNNIFAAVSS